MIEAKPRVFLSYARADRARVGKLAESLQAAGIAVWWDTAIETGSRFSADIERELNAADVVVVVWSAASVNSAWVLDEAGAGRDRGRLVPVQIDTTPPPLGFRQYQATDLAAWKGRASDPKFAGLIGAIKKMAGSEAQAAPAPTPAPATGPNRRALIGGAAGVAALAAGGFGAWKFMGQKADDGTASVVVLPFANLSGDPAQAFFSDGIAEELRNALSQIRGLKVIGRVSSEKFRDTDDLAATAEKLGVDHVLTGSVRRSPTTIRIGAQLVDGRTGVESWSQSYDQPVGDALAIQSKIATSVVAALSAKLAKAAGAIVVGGTDDAQAQELFLKAQSLYYRDRSEAVMQEVSSLLDSAVARDPNYAEAWAGLGSVRSNLRSYAGSTAQQAALLDAAIVAGKRATELAPGSGFALALLAGRWMELLDMRRGVAEGRRAVALAPADARALNAFAQILAKTDPDAAVEIARGAVALDPFNPTYFETLSGALLWAHRNEEGVAAARQALALSDNQRGGNQLFYALLAQNQIDAARANLRYTPFEVLRLTFAAVVEARAGNRAASDAALASLRRRDDQTLNYRLATVYAQRGETGSALAALEQSLRRKEPVLSQIAVDQWFNPIRREPRFKAVQDAVIPPDLFVPPKRR